MNLSILIPMYNASSYIGNCLKSLINQNLSKGDFEVIIMDDGSIDNSKIIVNEFLKSNKNFSLYEEVNSGVDSTRNKLLKLAKGNYIYFLDADDYLAYNSLGKILDYAKNYDLDIIGFHSKVTNSLNDYQIGNVINNKDLVIQNGIEFIKNNRHLRHEIWWYLIKKSFLDSANITFDKSKHNSSGDVVFTLKLFLSANKIGHYPISIHRYLQTENSITRNNTKEKNARLINAMSTMIINYSKLINSLIDSNISDKEIILENLRFRRDVFAFFIIIKMIKNKLHVNEVKKKLLLFQQVDAYPVNNFIGQEYHSLKYKFLNKVMNNKRLLLIIISIRNILK